MADNPVENLELYEVEEGLEAFSAVSNVLEVAEESDGFLLAVQHAIENNAHGAVPGGERLDHHDAAVPARCKVVGRQVVVHELSGRLVETSDQLVLSH